MTSENNNLDKDRKLNKSVQLGEEFAPFENILSLRSPYFLLHDGKRLVGNVVVELDYDKDHGAVLVPEEREKSISQLKGGEKVSLVPLEIELLALSAVLLYESEPEDTDLHICTLRVDNVVVTSEEQSAAVDKIEKLSFFEKWKTKDGSIDAIVVDTSDTKLIQRIKVKFDKAE